MASICGSPVCAGGKPKLKFTYTGDYVVRKDGVVELLTSGTSSRKSLMCFALVAVEVAGFSNLAQVPKRASAEEAEGIQQRFGKSTRRVVMK